MRVLCTCVPGFGHFHPMVPMARALQAAGHEVAFATEARFCPRVERAGFAAFPAGLGPGVVARRALAGPGTGALTAAELGARMFAGIAGPAKVPGLLAAIDGWSPSLVLSDVTDFAGPVAAASAGVAHAAHSLGPAFPLDLHRRGAGLAAPMWLEHGLAPPPLGGMFATVYLDICPPGLQTADLGEVATTVHPLRPVPFDAVAGETLPAWVAELGGRPTVYVTLGTLDNDAPGVLEAVVVGLRDEPLHVVVTVGPNRDPEELGPQPANVRVERYVPQSLLLPSCDAVVAHGGSSTMLAALAHGLPLVLLPQGANQFANAERCAAVGAGIRLLPPEIEPASVRTAVRAVLEQPGYRRRAREVAGEIERMPPPHDVVPFLENLVAQNG